MQLTLGFCAGATSRAQPRTRAGGSAEVLQRVGLFSSALFKNSSFCAALRNLPEPRQGVQWPPSPWERSWLSVLPRPRASPLLPCPPLPPQMLGTEVSQLAVSSPVL